MSFRRMRPELLSNSKTKMHSDSFNEMRRAHRDALRDSFDLTRRLRAQVRLTEAAVLRSRQLLSEGALPERSAPACSDPQSGQEHAGPDVASGTGGELIKVIDRHFSQVPVLLDGKHFVGCSLEDCVLEYSGAQVILERTNFSGCRFNLQGAAAMTASILECFKALGAAESDDEAEAASSGLLN